MKKTIILKFGNTKKEADSLVKLVISGKKTATSSRYDSSKKLLPKVDARSIITDSNNMPRCLIITTKVKVIPFKKVNKEFAKKEGEGDRSLKYWRTAHKEFFAKQLKKIKKNFNEDILIVCEEFKVLKTFKK